MSGLPRLCVVLLIAFSSLVCAGCFETEKGQTFYGRVTPPAAQEFRWSDGGLPRVFDPALAAAPPDTDAVRALFEGLTDLDPVSLEPSAAVATRWETSADKRTWTFHLRQDARWSNGDPVTAKDFVRSWQRTLRLGDRAPHARLLENIEGAQSAVALITDPAQQTSDENNAEGQEPSVDARQTPSPESADAEPRATPSTDNSPARAATARPQEFGARALSDYVLSVRLKRPDQNFPALVAHPVFRPVHEVRTKDEKETDAGRGGEEREEEHDATETVVSNGAFRLLGRAADSVVLERASNYWGASAVALERVRFVATKNPEEALAAYRDGHVDAVTNAAFEPLALKLLAPYKDFRRATYGALTYYSFNLSRPPFNDRRVREAFAVALDRERLSADTLGGATEPAKKFLPKPAAKSTPPDAQPAPSEKPKDERPQRASEAGDAASLQEEKSSGANNNQDSEEQGGERSEEQPVTLEANAARARRLLAEAGFPGGAGFPRVRLLINRNEQQRVIAQALAAAWRGVLGVETEIVVRNWDEYEAALWTGDYDIARRSMVMQTTDEESNMLAMFGRVPLAPETTARGGATNETAPSPSPAREEAGGETARAVAEPAPQILTEEQALRELPAFPLYFASSYALVKPYVVGFDANLLDAPSLKRLRIDTRWKPPESEAVIRVVSNK